MIMQGHGGFGSISCISMLVLGVIIFYHGMAGNELNPLFSMVLGLVIAVLGIIGLIK